MLMLQRAALLILALAVTAAPALARVERGDSAGWTAWVGMKYRVISDISYLNEANYSETKLDLFIPENNTTPLPTLIFLHGGGWISSDKASAVLYLLPYLEMGWAVVNVNFRLGPASLAPAAVEDCRCALRWVIRHAKEYRFDVTKLVMSGQSAGGHLALVTGMLPVSAGLDRECPGNEELKVAAIVSWSGITDVLDVLEGPNARSFAVRWLGGQPNRDEIARRISPINYVRKSLPPIFIVHGDADARVPYQQALRLHQALTKAGVPNELFTIHGGGHGRFSRADTLHIYDQIEQFLADHGLTRAQ